MSPIETAMGLGRVRLGKKVGNACDFSLLFRSVARQCAMAALKGDEGEFSRLSGLVGLFPSAIILGRLDDATYPAYVFLVG